MTISQTPPGGGSKRPGHSTKGAQSDQARKDRQAAQLRANLAKRKQQQRKRDVGEDGGGGS